LFLQQNLDVAEIGGKKVESLSLIKDQIKFYLEIRSHQNQSIIKVGGIRSVDHLLRQKITS